MDVIAQTMLATVRKVLDFFNFRMRFLSNMLLASVMVAVEAINEKYIADSYFLNCISSKGRSAIAIKDTAIQIVENFIMTLDIMKVI
ncbi:hypothetical protein WS52_08660 [Burkholderia territorii]|nr:hypothetical protein WS52_08660 [Burkholderia territorii]KUZ54657.1 hypothetical protein WS53_13905 [Burkholderia territorii]